MALSDHYNETVTIKRLEYEEDDEYQKTGKQSYVIHLEDVACEIQPLESSINQDISVAFGKNYLMFCDIIDLKEGDRVFREDGSEWRVVGLENYDEFRGNEGHMEVSIRSFKS